MILVAGGNGYLGKPLCQKLVGQGKSVISFDLTPAKTDEYLSVTGDVRDTKSIEKTFSQYPIETVVDLAAVLDSASTAHPLFSFQVNVLGIFNLLNCCQSYKIKRFVMGSSYAALGNLHSNGRVIDETFTPEPVSFYGQTKAFGEKMGISYSKLCNFQFVAGRMPIIVGPGEPTPTSSWRANIFNQLSQGGKLLIDFTPEQVLPLVHYEDAAQALTTLIVRETIDHSIYHLPYEDWKVSALAQTLTEINPSLHVSFGERIFTGTPSQLSFTRFDEEFGLPKPSIKKYLIQTMQQST